MSRHTPGRWHTLPDSPTVVRSDALGPGYFSALLIASDREPNPVHGGGIPTAQAVANARLIAAAPDMLAALIDVKAMLEVYTDPRGRFVESTRGQALSAIRDAIAAIAKAKGE
jgi:hypothetical protein